MKVAKLFNNGGSQAVRLPAEFRFDGSEVYVRRDPATGDVILSKHAESGSWAEFFALRDASDIPSDFMAERPGNEPQTMRDPFDESTP